MAESIALNCDCMEYMKTLPDNAFDLAVVDPPYGDALNTHTHTQRGRGTDSADASTSTRQPLRFHGGDRWNKYLQNRSLTQQLSQERERERERERGQSSKLAWEKQILPRSTERAEHG